MSINAIRNLIEDALLQEQQNQLLAKHIERLIPSLHPSIRLPQSDGAGALVGFVETYVRHVPDFIASVRAIASQAGIYRFVEPFLSVSEAFFLNPPEITDGREGLEAHMGAAFLTHRLLEEVNDIFMARTGFPLLALDMTSANLVIHALIGEPYSNQLDSAVGHIVAQMMSEQGVFQSAEFNQFLNQYSEDKSTDDWESLARQHGIEIGDLYCA